MSSRTGVMIGMIAVFTGVLFADILLILAGSVVMAMESARRHRDEQEK